MAVRKTIRIAGNFRNEALLVVDSYYDSNSN